jgi:hypothetical protein
MSKKKEKLPESDEQYWVTKEDTKPEEEGDGEAQSYDSDKELE